VTATVIVDAAGFVIPGGPRCTLQRNARLTGATAGRARSLASFPTTAAVRC